MENPTMYHRPTPTRIAQALLSLLSIPLFFPSFASAQEDQAPDPWFTEERSVNLEDLAASAIGEEDEDENSVSLRSKNPNALAKELRKAYEVTPESNLSKRISLLEEIVSLTPNKADDERAALPTLKAEKDRVLGAIRQVGSGQMSLEESIQALGPHAAYLKGDPSLLFQLLRTSLSQRLDARVRFLGSNNDTASLAELNGLIEANGLGPVLGSRIDTSASDSLSDAIARRWRELTQGVELLPGEEFLLGKLLNNQEMKLRMAIDLPRSADPRLAENITRSIENNWGNTLELIPSERREPKSRDLVLKIDADEIRARVDESASTAESMIPGAIVEEPNPDFLELVERYEKAAKSYETALKSYEMQYDVYLQQFEQGEYDHAQSDLKMAEQRLEATPQFDTQGQITPEYAAARAEFEGAEALANSLSPSYIPEPVKPAPNHLKILEDLYLVPSTLIISEEKTPYEYTTKDLVYVFETDAILELESPATAAQPTRGNVSLSQIRNWTKNEGVDPRDPIVGEGSFSEREYDSALNLFSLEFASRCVRELKSLMSKTAAALRNSSPETEGLSNALLYLALSSASEGSKLRALSSEELSELANLARSSETTLPQLRAAYLSRILENSPFAEMADERKLAQLL